MKKIKYLWICLALLFLGGCGAKKEGKMITCQISINCGNVLSQMDKLKETKREYIPGDGWILEEVSVQVSEGSSVFDLLSGVCREKGIQMEFSESPVYRSAYIEGIQQLYELDCGASSGWMYRVNKEVPRVGCSSYKLKDGDTAEFIYTCDLGADVGREME